MDENTKHLVASNLTIAHFAAQPISQPSEPSKRKLELVEESVIATYERFLTLLDESESTKTGT